MLDSENKEKYNILVQQITESVVQALNLENGKECATEDVPPMTLTVEEMARELNISLPTAYDLARTKRFPAFRIGKKVLISRAGLLEWIEAKCRGGT